jgi:predicted transcriptional regulator
MAEEIGRTEERVRQHIRSGRIIRDESYGIKLYRIADGFSFEKGRIKPLDA